MANAAFIPNATPDVSTPAQVPLGDFVWVMPVGLSRKAPIVKVPRCTGVRIKDVSTPSSLVILVRGWATKINGSDNPRSNVEAYVRSMWKAMGGRKGTIAIGTDSYTNCVPVSCSADSEDSKYLRFSIRFSQDR